MSILAASSSAALTTTTRVWAVFSMRFDRLAQAVRNRREINALASFDERMLHDIGLSRADVNNALATRFGADPSSQLAMIAAERAVFSSRSTKGTADRAFGALDPSTNAALTPAVRARAA